MTASPYQKFCAARQQAQQFRQIKTTQILSDGEAVRDGQRLTNFASNDYLGLSQHPALIAAAQDYAGRFGAGSTASRLITGTLPIYAAIEEKLAHGKGCETALVMTGGYQTNLTVLAALTGCRGRWQTSDDTGGSPDPPFPAARRDAERGAAGTVSA